MTTKPKPIPDGYHTFTPYLIVSDVAQATAAGAKVQRPVQNQFYGDRSGMLTDPFGHSWNIATHVEDVSPEEINKRAAALHGNKEGAPK